MGSEAKQETSTTACMLFVVGMDVFCPRCQMLVNAGQVHECHSRRDEDEIERVRRGAGLSLDR